MGRMETRQKASIGRPRGFDADEALEQAMRVFWEQGYEGAGLTDLTNAMGITRTSMYAAFGNKEALFRKALERYTEGPASYGARALEEPTARQVATAFLNGSVRATTRPDCPAGCLGVQGSPPPAPREPLPATPSPPGATSTPPCSATGSGRPSTTATSCPPAPIPSCSPATS